MEGNKYGTIDTFKSTEIFKIKMFINLIYLNINLIQKLIKLTLGWCIVFCSM